MAEEVLIRISVDSNTANKSIKKVAKETDKLAAIEKKLAFETSEKGKATALANERLKEERKINRDLARQKLKLNAEVKKETFGSRMLSKAKEKLNFLRSEEALELQRVNTQIKIQNDVNTSLINSEMGLATSKASVNARSKQFRTQIGLNNAIIMEAGRLASDLRFGFTGIANNVGQLASLFGSLATTGGNLRTSLSNLGKQLIGTGGLLIAVQLIIAYGDRIFNFFMGISESAAAAEKSLKKIKEQTAASRVELEGYLGVLSDANSNEEARKNAIDELVKVSPDLQESYKKEKLNLDELNKSIETYIKQQALRSELDALVEDNKELFADAEKIRRLQERLDNEEDLEKRKEIYRENVSFLDRLGIFRKDQEGELRNFFDADLDYAELYRRQNKTKLDEAKANAKRIREIQDQLIPEIGSGTGEGERDEVLAIFANYFGSGAAQIIKNRNKITKLLKGISKEQLLDQAKKGRERELLQLDLDHHFRMLQLESANATSQDLLAAQEDYLRRRADLIGKYNNDELKKKEDFDRMSKARLERDQLAERRSRIDHLQSMLSALSGFLQNSAELNEQNKALAKASIIASAAAASVGVWEAWLVKDKTFNPAPVKVAGAIATQGAIIASTISALKSLNSEQPITGEGSGPSAQVYAPDFNVVGASPINQLAGVASRSLGSDNAPVAVVSLNSLNVKQGQLNRIKETAGT